MADLASTAVTVKNSWYGGLGKEIIHREVDVTLSGQGSTSNKITAEALGLDEFEGISVLTKDDDSAVVVGAPSADKKTLLLKAAATNAPADYTGDFTGVITGR